MCLVLALSAVLLVPLQLVFAEDDTSDLDLNSIGDLFRKISENDVYESMIRQALAISENLALQVAQNIGYDFSKSYFENYVDISKKNLTFEHILLTVIFSYNADQYSNILSTNPFLRQFELDKIIQTSEQKKEEIRNKYEFLGTYDKDAWQIIENNARRTLIVKYSDRSQIDALNKPLSIEEELAIGLIQAAPCYDPKTGQLITLNQTMTDVVQDIPALEGTDVSKNPIRSGVLFATEPEYAFQTKLIKTKDGHILSLEEATLYNYKNDDVRKAKLALRALDYALDIKKIDDPERKVQEFIELINGINRESEYLIKK